MSAPVSTGAGNWAIDPVDLAAELIRRPSVTPKDEGALDIVASRLERLGFVCHRLVFDDPGPQGEAPAPIANLYARRGSGRPNLCFAGHTDVVPPGPAGQLGDMTKIGRRRSMTGRVTGEGVQGHVAYAHLTDNAAHRLIALLQALTLSPLDSGTEHFQPSSLQVTTIDIGNPATNVVPGIARATFNARFNDRWTSDTLKSWVADRLAAVGGKYQVASEVSGERLLVP